MAINKISRVHFEPVKRGKFNSKYTYTPVEYLNFKLPLKIIHKSYIFSRLQQLKSQESHLKSGLVSWERHANTNPHCA